MGMLKMTLTVDPSEVAKFEAMAAEWWNPDGKFKPLHMMNPVRLDYITTQIAGEFDRDLTTEAPFAGLRILELCVFDGLLKQFSTPAVREMLLNGMHRNIFSVHSNQYMEPMPGMVRWSFDYVFVTRQTLEESIEKIWKYFASYTMFPDLENFRKVLEKYTEGHRVLVLEPTKMKAYWYDPQLHPPFRVFENDLLWALEKKTN